MRLVDCERNDVEGAVYSQVCLRYASEVPVSEDHDLSWSLTTEPDDRRELPEW